MGLYGGVEAGGTKFVCAVGDGRGSLYAFVRFPTTTPDETLGRAVRFFSGFGDQLGAVGVGSFGPVDLDPGSPTFGFVTTTPKPGWANADVRGALARALGQPVFFTTDVAASAIGEHRFTAAKASATLVYLTVGTGIGGCLLVRGEPLHGLVHAEMGHVPVRRMPGDAFAGVCPYHGDCLEGMASGPALAARAGASPRTLPPGDAVWDAAAHYLGEGVAALVLALSPHRIIAGGGVLGQPGLLARVRVRAEAALGGYVRHGALANGLADYLVPPVLGERAGVLGAMAFARESAAA